MMVARSPQTFILLSASAVAAETARGPVVYRISQSRATGVAHADSFSLAALPGHRGRAGITAESLIISFPDRPRSLGQKSCSNGRTDARDGQHHVCVTRCLLITRSLLHQRVQQPLDPVADFPKLLIEQLYLGKQEKNMLTSCLTRAWS